jgi:hypothetical protein
LRYAYFWRRTEEKDIVTYSKSLVVEEMQLTQLIKRFLGEDKTSCLFLCVSRKEVLILYLAHGSCRMIVLTQSGVTIRCPSQMNKEHALSTAAFLQFRVDEPIQITQHVCDEQKEYISLAFSISLDRGMHRRTCMCFRIFLHGRGTHTRVVVDFSKGNVYIVYDIRSPVRHGHHGEFCIPACSQSGTFASHRPVQAVSTHSDKLPK